MGFMSSILIYNRFILAELVLHGGDVNGMSVGRGLLCYGYCGSCRFSEARAYRHDSYRRMSSVICRETSARDQHIVVLLGEQRAVRNGVIFARLKAVYVSARAERIVNIYIVISECYSVIKLYAALKLVYREHVNALKLAALSHAYMICDVYE